MTPKERAIIAAVGCPRENCRAEPGQPCRRVRRGIYVAVIAVRELKHPHAERRDRWAGGVLPER